MRLTENMLAESTLRSASNRWSKEPNCICKECGLGYREKPGRIYRTKYCSNPCKWKNASRAPKNILWTEDRRKKFSDMCKLRVGEKSPRLIKDRTKLQSRQVRNDSAYKNWRHEVYKEGGACALKDESCHGKKVVHHILRWSEYENKRYDVSNGLVLCWKHHPRTRKEEDNSVELFQRLVAERK